MQAVPTIFSLAQSQGQDVISFFASVFTESESKEEGVSVGRLVADLINTTNDSDLAGFAATLDEKIVGAIFFSRLTLADVRSAFILSPVAIATDQQGKGIGQQLIRYGIEALQSRDVDLLFTYGDPAFYSKVGFEPISEAIAKAPFTLSQPEGWLAQSLTGEVITPIPGVLQCVPAFNKPELW